MQLFLLFLNVTQVFKSNFKLVQIYSDKIFQSAIFAEIFKKERGRVVSLFLNRIITLFVLR